MNWQPGAPNTLMPATAGDTTDVRTLELTGVTDIAEADTITVTIWRHDTSAVELTDVTPVPDTENQITVDLAPWTESSDPGDWLVDIDIDGTSWPSATRPARITLRPGPPAPTP